MHPAIATAPRCSAAAELPPRLRRPVAAAASVERSSSCPSSPPSAQPFAGGVASLSSKSLLKFKLPRASIIPRSSAVVEPALEKFTECTLPTWSQFELGTSAVFWKTQDGLPPASGRGLTLFYNPTATKLVPNEEYGIAFNGGFNQPIMCGGESRIMIKKNRGKADAPIYSIRIQVPKHAVCLIFSFTNGVEWDGPYKLQFEVPKSWRNKPLSFYNEGLVNELNQDGACELAIYPDANKFIPSCEIGSLYYVGGDRCNLNLVPGCMDPSSPLFNPLANVDDGSCPLELDSEQQPA